jgi:hypothetical protein
MPFYRKRAVTIEAIQYTGDNADEIMTLGPDVVLLSNKLVIITLEGDMRANIGDWVIKGVADELYPCRNDVFLRTYEPADA